MRSNHDRITRMAILATLFFASASIPGVAAADGIRMPGRERVRMRTESAATPGISVEEVRARDQAHARAYRPLEETYRRLDALRERPLSPAKWNSDVLMSAGDSLVNNAQIDFSVTTGTYYGCVWHPDENGWIGSKLFQSVDDGLSWEGLGFTYYQSLAFSDLDWALCDSLIVCAGACSIEGRNYIVVDLCSVRNGTWEHPVPVFFSETEPVHSIALATDYDNYPTVPYLYLAAHIGTEIHFWRSVDYGRNWIDHAILDSGDVRFPDIAYGWNTAGMVYVVYGKDQSVYLDRNSTFGALGAWTLDFASWSLGDSGNMPVVAGIADSIQVVFERANTSGSYRHLETRATINGGGIWYGTILSGGALEYMYPDLTGRGGAFRLAYLEFTETERHVVYTQCRDTAIAWWTPALTINDHFPFWDVKPYGNPCVEYLPGNRAGVVYTGFYESRKVWIDYEENPVTAVGDPVRGSRIASIGPLPNPLCEPTPIHVVLEESGFVRLELHDLGGRVVSRFFEGSLDAGDHPLDWPVGSIPPGIYFLRLTQGDAVDTRKVTVLGVK